MGKLQMTITVRHPQTAPNNGHYPGLTLSEPNPILKYELCISTLWDGTMLLCVGVPLPTRGKGHTASVGGQARVCVCVFNLILTSTFKISHQFHTVRYTTI